MINNFSTFLVESEKQIFFTFSKMNPPTISHEKLFDILSKEAGSNPYRIYTSQAHDLDNNPLEYADKIKVARKMFPKHARSIIIDKHVKTVMNALVAIYNDGWKNIHMVVPEDKVRAFSVLINKYNGVEGRQGLYKFENINVISSGQIDPDNEGMASSKMRQHIKENDYMSFSQGLSKSVGTLDARRLYNEFRKSMNLSEEKDFVKHIQLEPVSEKREMYVSGELFQKGDLVVIKENDEVGEIKICGTNYVIIEMADKKQIRKWLDDIEKITGEK